MVKSSYILKTAHLKIINNEEFDVTLRPSIDIVSAHDNKSISFI